LLIFLTTNVIFCTETSLISYGGFNSSQDGALCGLFLLGQSPHCPVEVTAYDCRSPAALSSKPTARLLMSVNGTELKDGRTPDRYIVTYFFGFNRFQCLLCTFSSLPVFKYFLYACSSIHFTFFIIAIGWLAIAKWLACWTQARKGPVSNRSRDAVG